MSTTQGVWNETLLQNIREKADRIMLDSNLKNDLIPRIDVLKTLFDNQIAKVNPLLADPKKDKVVEVEFMHDCDDSTCDEITACSYGGDELSSNVKEYEIDYEKQKGFTVKSSTFRTNDFGAEEALAMGILKKKKLLAECFAQYAVGVLTSNSGVNQLTQAHGGMGIVSGANTYISASQWSANTISYLMRVAQFNQINNPMILSGANLHQAYLNAIFGMKPEDVGRLFGAIPISFDEWNIDTTNSPLLYTYLLDKGSYAIANKVRQPGEITADIIRSVENDEMLGNKLQYETYIKRTCYLNETNYDVSVILRAGFYVAPTGCDAAKNGILTFICGEPS